MYETNIRLRPSQHRPVYTWRYISGLGLGCCSSAWNTCIKHIGIAPQGIARSGHVGDKHQALPLAASPSLHMKVHIRLRLLQQCPEYMYKTYRDCPTRHCPVRTYRRQTSGLAHRPVYTLRRTPGCGTYSSARTTHKQQQALPLTAVPRLHTHRTNSRLCPSQQCLDYRKAVPK